MNQEKTEMRREKKKDKVKTDVILKEFWRSNERFADLFNAVLFNGESVLKAEDLTESDTDVSGILQLKDHNESLTSLRDVIKKSAFGTDFVIWGLENQMKVHYAMPLRNLLYDGLGYLKEYRMLAKSHKGESGLTEAEFLSGLKKEDRFHPIVSIVVYYGDAPYDGPLTLKDMMVEMPVQVAALFSDYKINLLQVRNSDSYCFENEDVKTVFEISREIFRNNFAAIEENYREKELDPELISVIGKITDSSFLMEQGKDRRESNMCRALEELEKQGIAKGREEGREEGRQEGAALKTRNLVFSWLERGFSIAQIAGLLELTEAEVLKIQSSK